MIFREIKRRFRIYLFFTAAAVMTFLTSFADKTGIRKRTKQE